MNYIQIDCNKNNNIKKQQTTSTTVSSMPPHIGSLKAPPGELYGNRNSSCSVQYKYTCAQTTSLAICNHMIIIISYYYCVDRKYYRGFRKYKCVKNNKAIRKKVKNLATVIIVFRQF